MIRIPQEELLKKIEQEHDQLFSSSQAQQLQQQLASSSKENSSRVASQSSGPPTIGLEAATKSLALAENHQEHFGKISRRASSSSVPTWVAPNSTDDLKHKDMSYILPSTYGSLRDRNNNNQGLLVNDSDQDDEIQAVLITGCGSKIGRNIAVAFASMGLNVALVDFNTQQTDSVARECQEKSPKNRAPLQIVADISQLDEAHKVIDRTIKEFGRLDVLVNTVNNASLMEAKFKGSGDDDPHVFEQYHKIIANNMHSVTYLCISAAPYLRKTKGSIVNVSSLTNNETGSYKFAYCMSKAGISTLTKCLATDLAPDIKVICVSPKSDQ